MGNPFETCAPPDSDMVVVDFREMAKGTPTRDGYVIAECPKCGKLGERRRPRAGRRQVVWLHLVRYLHHADGTWAAPDKVETCKQWETHEGREQHEFGGFIAGSYATPDGEEGTA